MTKAEILKREILSQYKSVRQFAIDMSIPYSTLVTALDRGVIDFYSVSPLTYYPGIASCCCHPCCRCLPVPEPQVFLKRSQKTAAS